GSPRARAAHSPRWLWFRVLRVGGGRVVRGRVVRGRVVRGRVVRGRVVGGRVVRGRFGRSTATYSPTLRGLRNDFDAELGGHLPVDSHGHRRRAERLERFGEGDLPLVHVESLVLQRLRDVLRGHRAVEG